MAAGRATARFLIVYSMRVKDSSYGIDEVVSQPYIGSGFNSAVGRRLWD